MLLCGAVAAVVAGQLAASATGPWVSMIDSAGAVLCTIAALVMGRRR